MVTGGGGGALPFFSISYVLNSKTRVFSRISRSIGNRYLFIEKSNFADNSRTEPTNISMEKNHYLICFSLAIFMGHPSFRQSEDLTKTYFITFFLFLFTGLSYYKCKAT